MKMIRSGMLASSIIALVLCACGETRNPRVGAPPPTTPRPDPTPPPPPAPPAPPDPNKPTAWAATAASPALRLFINADTTVPSIARGAGGETLLAWQEYDLAACLICTEVRYVERLDASGWHEVAADALWRGDKPAMGPQLALDATGKVLVADVDLYDAYHPPPRLNLHFWQVDGARQDLGMLADSTTSLYGATADRGPDGKPMIAFFAATDTSASIRIVDGQGAALFPALDLAQQIPGADEARLALKVDKTGAPVVAFCGLHGLRFSRFSIAGRAWEPLSSAEDPAATCWYSRWGVSLALTPAGDPVVAYVAYKAGSYSGQAVVRAFSASKWHTLSGLGGLGGPLAVGVAPGNTVALASSGGVTTWTGTEWKLALPATAVAPPGTVMQPQAWIPDGDGFLSVWSGYVQQYPNDLPAKFFQVLHVGKR